MKKNAVFVIVIVIAISALALSDISLALGAVFDSGDEGPLSTPDAPENGDVVYVDDEETPLSSGHNDSSALTYYITQLILICAAGIAMYAVLTKYRVKQKTDRK